LGRQPEREREKVEKRSIHNIHIAFRHFRSPGVGVEKSTVRKREGGREKTTPLGGTGATKS